MATASTRVKVTKISEAIQTWVSWPPSGAPLPTCTPIINMRRCAACMLTVSTELQPILNGIVQFISYMVLAVFAENVILARALGVTRLMKLVPDHRGPTRA